MSHLGMEASIAGVEALMHACSLPVEMLLPGCQSVDKWNHTFGMEPELYEALESDNDKKLKDFTSLRGETALRVTVQKFDGGKILHVAIRLGAIKCLKVLLNYDIVKAEIEAPDDKGRTALLVAVVSAQSEALKELLRAGANINARDDDYCGVLHLLLLELSKDNKEKVEWEHLMKVADLLLPISDEAVRPFPLDILDLEAHANLPCQEDATPLSAASAMLEQEKSAFSAPDIIKLCEKLIKVGANYSEVKDELESNAVDFDYTKRRPPQRTLDVKVIDEVCRGNTEDLEKELTQSQSNDATKKAVNSWVGQHSLLFWAVNEENPKMVEILLKFGAVPWVEGNLPIKRAAEKGLSFIFRLLLEVIKPTISQDDKDSLIHILQDEETDSHNECLKLIQDL